MKVGDRVSVPDGRTGILWQHLDELWSGRTGIMWPPLDESDQDWGWLVRLDKPFYVSNVKQTDMPFATRQITVIEEAGEKP